MLTHAATALALAAILLTRPALADPDTRLQLERLLQDIQAAVLAADANAYLALIDTTEPHFAREQANWAADLAKRPVAEFSISLDGDITAGDGSAEAAITLRWRLAPPPHARPDSPALAPRSASWNARFILADAPSAWLYAGEAWDTHHAPGALILHGPGLDNAAVLAAELLPDIREHVHQDFQFPIEHPLRARTQLVKLYNSMAHLQASIALGYTDPLGGWNEPGESIKLLARDNTTRRTLQDRLAHEYTHVATFELGPHATHMPWWVLEGVANLAAQNVTGSQGPAATVERWARENTLAPWDELARFDDAGRQRSRFVYAQGHHMLAYITNRFGPAARNAWMTDMANGAPLDQATQDRLGLPFTDLDTQWRTTLTTP